MDLRPIFIVFAPIIFGYVILKGLVWVGDGLDIEGANPANVQINPLLDYGLVIVVSWVLGIIPAGDIFSWAAQLWPDVEFDFGPEHQKIAKTRRKRIRVFLIVILAPLVIAIITSEWFLELFK